MYETPYETTGPYKQVDFLFLVELTGEKFQIEFFSYNKLNFLQQQYKFKCPSAAIYKHMHVEYLQIVFISSLLHFVRRSLENIFLL